MEQNIKRSFTGYRPKDLEKQLVIIKEEFSQNYNRCEKELQALIEENSLLKKEIETLEMQMKKNKELRKEIEQILYRAHIEACTRTFETARRFEEMMEYKMGIIKNQQHKNEEIKTLINRLMKKVNCIVEESF